MLTQNVSVYLRISLVYYFLVAKRICNQILIQATRYLPMKVIYDEIPVRCVRTARRGNRLLIIMATAFGSTLGNPLLSPIGELQWLQPLGVDRICLLT